VPNWHVLFLARQRNCFSLSLALRSLLDLPAHVLENNLMN
jgi:hypothetical protein